MQNRIKLTPNSQRKYNCAGIVFYPKGINRIMYIWSVETNIFIMWSQCVLLLYFCSGLLPRKRGYYTDAMWQAQRIMQHHYSLCACNKHQQTVMSDEEIYISLTQVVSPKYMFVKLITLLTRFNWSGQLGWPNWPVFWLVDPSFNMYWVENKMRNPSQVQCR